MLLKICPQTAFSQSESGFDKNPAHHQNQGHVFQVALPLSLVSRKFMN
jgi:hypothetical protein